MGLAHWYLALAYNMTGQYELALEEVSKAEKFGYDWRSNSEHLDKVVNMYKALGKDPSFINDDSQKRIESDLKALELRPADLAIWFDLAAAYANAGQYDKAREAALKIAELNPDSKLKVEEFLETLPK